jgi:hypothetical protein
MTIQYLKRGARKEVKLPMRFHEDVWGSGGIAEPYLILALEMRGQHHATDALPSEKERLYPLDRRFVSSRTGPDAVEKRNISCACRESNPNRPARSCTDSDIPAFTVFLYADRKETGRANVDKVQLVRADVRSRLEHGNKKPGSLPPKRGMCFAGYANFFSRADLPAFLDKANFHYISLATSWCIIKWQSNELLNHTILFIL